MSKKRNKPILVRTADEFQKGGMEIQKKDFCDETSLHWHDYYELEIILDGEGSYYINGMEFPMRRGSAYLVSPIDFHLIKGDFKLYNIAFKENSISSDVMERILSGTSSGVIVFDDEEFRAIEMTLDMLLAESQNDSILHDRALQALLDYLLIGYLRKTQSGEEEMNRSDVWVMRVVSYIKFNFKKKITLAEVANAIGLTPNYVGEVFTRRMGVSFNSYLMQTRLNYAKMLLLRGDCSVEEAAMMSGFGSQTYFSDCFRKHFNTTPTAVKKTVPKGRARSLRVVKESDSET